MDIFSRYVVGWMVAHRESAALAEVLIRQTCAKQGIGRDQLTIHADRGSSMTSKPVALLLADLGVTQSHSRPHVSDDNPFSEAQFKTLKYRPRLPRPFRLHRGRPSALPDLLRLVQQRTSPHRAGPARSRRRALRHRRHHPREARRRARCRIRRPPGTVRAKAARATEPAQRFVDQQARRHRGGRSVNTARRRLIQVDRFRSALNFFVPPM